MPKNLAIGVRNVIGDHLLRMLVILALAYVTSWAFLSMLHVMSTSVQEVVATAMAIGIVSLMVLMRASEWTKLQTVIPQSLSVLSAKRAQLTRPNEYGVVPMDAWHEEVRRFMSMHGITPDCFTDNPDSSFFRAALVDIESRCADRVVHPNSGTQYENDCCKLLDAYGWTTWLTPPSGDKGVDIVASKDGLKVAIQCKNYQSPVGTKAVQEIIAGCQYEKADHAVVVSEAEYSRQAIDLASSVGVLLLKSSDLATLYERIV